jgi:uncharacterized 2Fe-2S/4Fe-4S cluster protein (DUF4445 family)
MLMKRFRVDMEQIAKVYLAGAFGTYVDPESARMIGMYRKCPLRGLNSLETLLEQAHVCA